MIFYDKQLCWLKNSWQYCNLKIFEGCKSQKFMTNVDKSQKSATNSRIDQRFYKIAKVHNLQLIVIHVKDFWAVQKTTIHDQDCWRWKIIKGCKSQRFTDNVGGSGSSWKSEKCNSNIRLRQCRLHSWFWF